MDRNSRVLICGVREMVNKAFLRYFKKNNFTNFNDSNETSLDLTDQSSVMNYFKDYEPDVVIYTGSVSGGISVNMEYPAEFIYKNIISQANVINSAKEIKIKDLILFAASCVYPKDAPQPLKEEFLLTGSLEETAKPYAIAKIAGMQMCAAYNKQYKTNFIAVVPATTYGPEDDFNLKAAHVISALIRKFDEVKSSGKDCVEIWGSGKPRREFIFVDDLIDACIFLLDNYRNNEHINIGCSKDYTIKKLAEIISNMVGFKGKIRYDRSKPDGVKQKLLDSRKINSLGWKSSTSILDGLSATYRWYKEQIRLVKNDQRRS